MKDDLVPKKYGGPGSKLNDTRSILDPDTIKLIPQTIFIIVPSDKVESGKVYPGWVNNGKSVPDFVEKEESKIYLSEAELRNLVSIAWNDGNCGEPVTERGSERKEQFINNLFNQ